MSLMIRKTKRPKTARTAREKVSAVRRQSTETKLPESALTNDACVKALILELGELIEDAQREVAVTANAATRNRLRLRRASETNHSRRR